MDVRHGATGAASTRALSTVTAAPAAISGHTLRELFAALQAQMATRARRRHIALNIQPAGHERIEAPPDRLLRALCDLVGAAIDRAPVATTVRVRTRAVGRQTLLFVHSDGPAQPPPSVAASGLDARIGCLPRAPQGVVFWLMLPHAIAKPGEPEA